MPQDQLSDDEFAAKIKAKYPQYKAIPSKELTDKIVAKYPQYKGSLKRFASPEKKEGGFLSNLGADLKGMISAPRGVSPYPGMDIEGKTAIAEQSRQQSESEKKAGYGIGYRVAAAAGSAVGVNVPGMEESARKGDVGGVLGHAAAVPLVMAATEGAVRGAPKALRALQGVQDKGLPPAMTKAATKPIIQKVLYDRAMKVQEHIQTAADLYKQEVGERWKHIESTVDTAKPEGSIDVSGLRAEAQQAVKETIKTPQKLPETVKTIQKGAEPPKVFGERLDLSNPAHKALYEKLKEQGAIPSDRDTITFGEARQMRSKLGRELFGNSTLSGEARAVGTKVYDDLTKAMSAAAEEHGMEGAFADANKMHAQYMDDFVNRKSPLAKAIGGNNPHEIVGPLSDPKFAEQARRTMAKYQKHGIDPSMVSREGDIFQKLKSGLPHQLPMSRFEMMADIPTMGGVTGVRQAYNVAERGMAIRQVNKPNPVAIRAQALKSAAERLGPRASVKEIMAEADKEAP